MELYDYGARWYDPAIGRFLSPDTIIPNPTNPQSLNRYSYVYNNSMKYIDPSGHDPLDEEWETAFTEQHGRHPTRQDQRDRLFSLINKGSNSDGTWTDKDWQRYSENRDGFWGDDLWDKNEIPGIDRFVNHLNRLTSYYSLGEESSFTKAMGFIWGGIPYDDFPSATLQMGTDPQAMWNIYPNLFEGTANWRPDFVDDNNPSHHYAGLFYMGYFWGEGIGQFTNWLRDGPLSSTNVPDLYLGDLAAVHGSQLYNGVITMQEVGQAVRYALDARPGLWLASTPGRR